MLSEAISKHSPTSSVGIKMMIILKIPKILFIAFGNPPRCHPDEGTRSRQDDSVYGVPNVSSLYNIPMARWKHIITPGYSIFLHPLPSFPSCPIISGVLNLVACWIWRMFQQTFGLRKCIRTRKVDKASLGRSYHFLLHSYCKSLQWFRPHSPSFLNRVCDLPHRN